MPRLARIGEVVLFLFVLAMFPCSHFVNQLLAILLLLLLLLGAIVRRELAMLRLIVVCVWSVLFFLPIDVAIRDGNAWSISVVRVRIGFSEYIEQADAQRTEYVYYAADGSPVKAMWAVLVVIPTNLRIRTPLLSDPETPFLLGPGGRTIDMTTQR